jgi:hypothetical protein
MSIVKLIFTLDYEVAGNGVGTPYSLMIEPTYRLMNLMDVFGAKLTIMADVAEIISFKYYYEETGVDLFDYLLIKKQLQEAVLRGHDVQLHIHSAYFNSKYNKNWHLDYSEYNIAELPFERVNNIVKQSKEFLESMICEVKSDYSCIAYRSVGWSMMPTKNIYSALVNNGIKIDTSVYKWGKSNSFKANYDYSLAFSNSIPYRASRDNINFFDSDGKLTEYPIYTELKSILYFVSIQRFYRIIQKRISNRIVDDRRTDTSYSSQNNRKFVMSLFNKKAWKFDYNQATGRQMIYTLKKIQKSNLTKDTKIVLIGHSKTFNHYNEKTLDKFLKYASKQKNVRFGLFEK